MNELETKTEPKTILEHYREYFKLRTGHNWFIRAAMGTGKNYNLVEVLKELKPDIIYNNDLIIYSAPTTPLRSDFAQMMLRMLH